MSDLEIIVPSHDEEEKRSFDSPVLPQNVKPVAATPRTPGGGLSELSKQLRVLQAKNQAQSVEIDRLERQLRILADLQGISVADLRNALQQACEAEAFGEMQHRVASLRAELEAASLARANVACAAQDAANAKKIANLELRVGELEEVEEKQRGEIKTLYSQLMEQQTNSMRLESLSARLRSENEGLKLNQPKETTEDCKDAARLALQAEHVDLGTRAREAEMEAQILNEKLKLSEKQLEASEQQSILRITQFKARFMVQEENIHDLEQQLESLYVAFEMLREENAKDEEVRVALQTSLGMADAEVARQVDVLDLRYRSRIAPVVRGSPTASTVTGKKKKQLVSPTGKQLSPTPPLTDPVIAGMLLIKSPTGVIKKWKKRHVLLFSTLTHHHLDIGEERGYALQFALSRIEPYAKYPLGFLIRVGGSSTAVIMAAATNEQDYHRWMAALTYATTGEEYGSDRKETTTTSAQGDDEGSGSKDSFCGPSQVELEASDLELALEKSQREL